MKTPRLDALMRNPGGLTLRELEVLGDLIAAGDEGLATHRDWLTLRRLMEDGLAERSGPNVILSDGGERIVDEVLALARFHLGREA